MRRREILLAGGALLLAACAAPTTPTARAKPSGLPVLMESPPDLAALTTWFNSKPMTLADLKGQPFLMVFWTYT